MKIYFLRHQADGVLHDYPFSSRPTAAQISAFARVLGARHGGVHAKTGEPYWLRVVERELLGDDFMPQLPGPQAAAGESGTAAAGAVEFTVSGTGAVTNP